MQGFSRISRTARLSSPWIHPGASRRVLVIRRVSDDGIEYWSARNLAKILGYKEWRNFTTAIEKAKEACEGSGQGVQTILLASTKWFNWVLERNERQSPLLDDQAATDEA